MKTSTPETLSIPCQCCQSTGMIAQFEYEGYEFQECCNCKFVRAMPLNGNPPVADYSGYGDYLVKNNKALWFAKYRYMYRKLFALLKSIPKPAKVVDIGCGAGNFVAFCKDHGFEATGFEPSDILRKYAKTALKVGLVPSVDDLEEGTFDVVSSQDVIEHIDPLELDQHMNMIKSLLKPGGYFVGNTPNYNSLNVSMSGNNDPSIAPPHHVSHFNASSIEKFMHRHGFETEYVYTQGFFFPVEIGSGALAKLTRMSGKLAGLAVSPLLRGAKPDSGYQIHFAFRLKS
jgi:SAM-dependent methyltransferase